MISPILARAAFFLVVIAFGGPALIAQVDTRIPSGFSLQVNGQVRYAANNTPAENVLVRLESFSGGMVGQVNTDRTGKFIFTGLNPQQYIVTAHVPGYIDFSETVNLMTSNTAYVNARLVVDKNAIVNLPSQSILTPSTAVVDANTPPEAQNEYAKGKTLLNEGKKESLKEATQHLEKAVALYPAFLDAQLALGLAYMDLQQWKNAEKPLTAVIGLNTSASTAYFALGEVYRREKKYPEGEKTLLDGLAQNATSAEGHNTLAKLYWDMAPSSKTEDEFRSTLDKSWKEVNKALAIKPSLADAHLLAGNLLFKARKAEDALKHYEEYLSLDPKGEFAADTAALVQKIKQALAQTGKH